MKVRRLQPEYYPEERIVWDGRTEEDASNYESNLPNPDKLNIEKNDEGVWQQRDDDRDRTANFYRCLGYRLGATMRRLGETSKEIRKIQDDYGLSGFLWQLVETSTVVSAGAISGGKRVPSSNKAYHADMNVGGTGLHREIIRELHETEEIVPENHGRFAPAREKLWTFGHRNNKRRAPQFFNINKWPRSHDSSSTQTRSTAADKGDRRGTSGGSTRSSRSSSDSDHDDAPQNAPRRIPGNTPSNVVDSTSGNHSSSVARDAPVAQDVPSTESSNQVKKNSRGELDASQAEVSDQSSSGELEDEWPKKTHVRVERMSVHLGKFWGGDTRRQERFLVDQLRQSMLT